MAQEDTADDAQPAVDPAAAQKKKKLMLLLGIVAALLLVSGGGTWLLLGVMGGDDAKTETAAAAGGEVGKPAKVAAIYQTLEPSFLANFSVNGRQRYLQLTVAVMARDQATIDALNTHMPLVRNRLVMLLSGETFEQLQTDAGRVLLQQKLLAAIKEILTKETGKAGIEQVLFTNYVMT